MMENQISNLFNCTPLYTKKSFNLIKEKDGVKYTSVNELNSLNSYLGLTMDEKLISKCIFCKLDEIPFNLSIHTLQGFTSLSLFTYDCVDIINNAFWSSSHIISFEREHKISAVNNDLNFCILRYVFKCSNNESHFYFMDLLLCSQSGIVEVTKIGQYPESTLLVIDKNEKKYDELLKKLDIYIDYRNANKSYQYGLTVGSFDYERRILEKIISYFLIKNGHDELNNKDIKFDNKYEAIKDEFCPEIKQFIKPLYEALSGGVHFMTDDECAEHYDDLRNLINLQLEYMYNQSEQEKALSASATALAKLQSKYKTKIK